MRRNSVLSQKKFRIVGIALTVAILLFIFVYRSSQSYKQGGDSHWHSASGYDSGYVAESKQERASKRFKKIVVTGGAGFLGSHLCDLLIAKGHTVIAIDNFSSGRMQNVKHLIDNPKFSVIDHDVIYPIFIDCDQIYHLASPASPVRYQKDPIATFRTNVWGTYNMLMLANVTNARLFLSSTSEVYGDALEHPQKETYFGNVNPHGIRSCYDEGKRGAETLTFDFHRMYGVDIRVVRIFNTFGPRMDMGDGRVVSNFIVAYLENRPVSLYGSGKQTRSFLYVSDLIDGFVKVMENPFVGSPVNLGNPLEITVMELSDRIASILRVEPNVKMAAMPKDDPQRRKPDITLAKLKINWEPKIDLETGLRETISYFKEEIRRNGH